MGSYDTLASLDSLIAWLDDRGVLERALRHELMYNVRKRMEASRADGDGSDDESMEDDEGGDGDAEARAERHD